MRRVEEVIDAWFDSGAMPFAQHHYPFENRELIDNRIQYPADLISEAVDQTRGWFYTLHALGVLLFDSVTYKTCIVLGHVNDEQGRKMSKRLGNVVEPMAVIEEAGADALRWYFCVNNPEVPSRFSARLVREAAQGFLLPLWNALSLFTIYANLDGWRPDRHDVPPFDERPALDRWVLLRLDRLAVDHRVVEIHRLQREVLPSLAHPPGTSLGWRCRRVPVCVIHDAVVKVDGRSTAVRFRVNPDRIHALVLHDLLDPVLARQADQLLHRLLFHARLDVREGGHGDVAPLLREGDPLLRVSAVGLQLQRLAVVVEGGVVA
jgi:hypothetical protein